MKRLSVVSIFLFLAVFFSFNLLSQRHDPNDQQPVTDGLIFIDGWLLYENMENMGQKSILHYQLTIMLRKTNVYKIFKVTLNGKTLPDTLGVYYVGGIQPFECSVGDTIKLVVGIKKKNEFRQDPVYFTVAKYKIQNLFKNYIFPNPGQTIHLLMYPGSALNFEWKFTDFNQKTLLKVYGPLTFAFYDYFTGESCQVPKSNLEHNTTYRIDHGAYWGPKNKFIFTKKASKDSKLTFGHKYVLTFKTK